MSNSIEMWDETYRIIDALENQGKNQEKAKKSINLSNWDSVKVLIWQEKTQKVCVKI